jgi:hypothetical protein
MFCAHAAIVTALLVAQAGAPPQRPNWKEFTPREGGITVRIPPGTPPKQPERQEVTQQTQLGPITVRVYTLIDHGIAYQVLITDALGYSEDAVDAQDYLKGVQTGMLGSINGTLVSDQALNYEGLPGREVVADLAANPQNPLLVRGGSMRTRYVLTPRFVYQALVTIPKGTQPPQGDTEAFLGSITVSGKSNPKPIAEAAKAPGDAAAVREIKGAAPQPPPGWVPYKDPNGAFSAAFPKPPEKRQQKVPVPNAPGNALMQDLLVVEDGLQGAYLLMIQDMPPGAIPAGQEQTALDGAIGGMTRTTPGKVVKKESIRLNGNPGRDVEIELNQGPPGGGKMLARAVMVGDRLYLLLRVGPSEMVEADGQALLDSFRPTAP